MAGRAGRRKLGLAAGLGTCAALLGLVQPAAARADHRRHLLLHPIVQPAPAAPVDTGFGPTAPGMSAILIDAGNGAVISAAGADIPRYPASLTKLMVLDLAFQALRQNRMTLDTQIPVSYHAATVEPVKLGLQPGDTLTVRQAILSMTTMSANDAATALGEYLGGGSEYRCGQMMTLRAHAIGMAQSQFYNASGLPNPNQITTARDLSILARDIVVSYPEDQSFFEVQKFDFNGRTIYSNNQMLKLYPGATGMKTGYTILAKHNLITSADRDGKILIGVVLHEPSWGETYHEMTAMLDDGFGGHVAGTNPAPDLAVATDEPSAAPAAPVRNVNVPLTHAKPAQPIQLAARAPLAGKLAFGWTAQIGSFTQMAKARTQAVSLQHQRGVGIPRIARVERHGKLLWTAQLAGLTQTAAHATCSALAAKRTSCTIIAPQSDHMAARDTSDG